MRIHLTLADAAFEGYEFYAIVYIYDNNEIIRLRANGYWHKEKGYVPYREALAKTYKEKSATARTFRPMQIEI